MLIVLALIHFAIAGLIMAFVNHIGLMPWRRAPDAHWTERARLLYPARETAGRFRVLLPVLIPLFWYNHDYSSCEWVINILSTYLGAVVGCYPLFRESSPRVTFKWWFYSTFCHAIFNVYLIGGLLACITFMPPVLGWQTLVVVILYFALANPLPGEILNGLSLRAGYLKPAGERLQRLVRDAAVVAGVVPKTVWQLTWPYPSIRVTPGRPAIFATDQLLADFSDEEIVALCTRELAKISAPKSFWDKPLAFRLCLLPALFIIPLNHYWPAHGLLMIVPALFLAVWANRNSLKRKLDADQVAAGPPTPDSPFARALEKIHRENLLPAVSGGDLRLDLYQRMITGGITPDFPAPKPPSGFTRVGSFILVLILLITLVAGGSHTKSEAHYNHGTNMGTNQIINTN